MRVNIERTREYYASLDAAQLCDCAYCENFRREVRAVYGEAAAYLDGLGIAMEKAFETSPLEVEPDGTIAYCLCQYVVFGSCEEDFRKEIGGVTLTRGRSYPATGIEEEHFVMDLFPVRLPWRIGD